MAPLPTTNTGRLFLDYTSNGIVHTQCLRFQAGVSVTDALATAILYATELAVIMRSDDAWTAARWSASGQTISNPAAWLPISGDQTGPFVTWAEDPESKCYTYGGRDGLFGRKLLLRFFHPLALASWPASNRRALSNADVISAALQNAVDKLSGEEATAPLVSIAGQELTYYPYANYGSNGYWQREQRT